MNKTFLIACTAAALFCGCTRQEPSPVEKAILQRVASQAGTTPEAVRLDKVELVDSSTFRQEFARRREVFRFKLDQDTKMYEQYRSARKANNAAVKFEAMKKDIGILARLDSLEQSLSGRIDEVAFYDYRFSATGKLPDGGRLEVPEMFIALTPDSQVVSMAGDRKALRKGTGRVIPGYLEIFGRAE